MYEAGVDLILTPYRGPRDRLALVAHRAEPVPPRGRAVRGARARSPRAPRRHARAPREESPERVARRPRDARGDPALRDAALAAAPERDPRAGAGRRRGRRLHRPDEPPARDPDALRERFGVPVVYYDADVPMSLPEFGGMDTGFNIYHGADPGEYDLVLSNSEGGLGRLRELGARRAEHLFWGADPELFAPQPVEKELDVFFYAYGDKFRRDWMDGVIGEPSRRLPEVDFALGGTDFQGDVGRAAGAPLLPGEPALPRDLVGARQPERRPQAARRGARVLDEPAVRARGRGRGDRDEPVRGHRALVRARAASCVVVGARTRRSRRTAELLADPGAAERARPAGARARARRAHVRQAARRLLDLVGVGSPSTTPTT